jgi:hypothetical protein
VDMMAKAVALLTSKKNQQDQNMIQGTFSA